jgi:hypothetical protein
VKPQKHTSPWAFGATFSFHAKQLSNNIHTAHQQLPSGTHVCAPTGQGGDKVGGKKVIFPSNKKIAKSLVFPIQCCLQNLKNIFPPLSFGNFPFIFFQ